MVEVDKYLSTAAFKAMAPKSTPWSEASAPIQLIMIIYNRINNNEIRRF